MNDLSNRTSSEHRSPPDPALSKRPALVTLSDLPPPGTNRWVVSRKAAVVAGVREGLLSLDEALQRYGLSLDEFMCWKRLIDDHGVKGLRVTRIKEYRGRDLAEPLAAEDSSPPPAGTATCAA